VNLLVTGGAGFIGSNFVRHILGRGSGGHNRVVNLDKLTYAGNRRNLKDLAGLKGHVFVKGDILDRGLVRDLISDYRVTGVVNFAAETHVDRSLAEASVFMRTNVLGVESLLSACLDSRRKGRPVRFVQVSTDEVYGPLGKAAAFREDAPLAPSNPYAASKAAADLVVRSFRQTWEMDTIVTRSVNNYGPFQHPEKLIPLMALNCLRHRPLPVYGDGKQARDWLFVGDHCRALEAVLKAGKPGATYNISAGVRLENREVVSMIVEILAGITADRRINRGLIRRVADRPGHDREYRLDSGRIRRELGWRPKTGFERGLRETLGWYAANRGWLSAAAAGRYEKWYALNYGRRSRRRAGAEPR
jgi:dTDP-glucose 4,6-dehydratase